MEFTCREVKYSTNFLIIAFLLARLSNRSVNHQESSPILLIRASAFLLKEHSTLISTRGCAIFPTILAKTFLEDKLVTRIMKVRSEIHIVGIGERRVHRECGGAE